METETKKKVSPLKAGIHLVCVADAMLIKDDKGLPKVTEQGDMGITVRYGECENIPGKTTYCSIDKDYWRKDGEWDSEFKKMCQMAFIDITQPKFKKESKGKRMWLFVKEVHHVQPNGSPVTEELSDAPVVTFDIFDYQPYLENGIPPMLEGNPQNDENGVAFGDFLGILQTQETHIQIRTGEEGEYTVQENNLFAEEVSPKTKEQIIAEQREMIKKVESGQSVKMEEPVSQEKDPFDLPEFAPEDKAAVAEEDIFATEDGPQEGLEDKDIKADNEEIDWDNI